MNPDPTVHAPTPPGEPVSRYRIGPEPGGHVGARQFGELSDASNPHAPQQVGQIFPAWCRQTRFGGQLPDREGSQKVRVPTGLDDAPGASGEHRGGQLVGDADLTLRARRGDRVHQPLRGRLLRPEVAGRAPHGQHQQARPQHLRAWHDLVDCRRHAFEVPGVTAGIGGGYVDTWAARRRPPCDAGPCAPRPPEPRPNTPPRDWPV